MHRQCKHVLRTKILQFNHKISYDIVHALINNLKLNLYAQQQLQQQIILKPILQNSVNESSAGALKYKGMQRRGPSALRFSQLLQSLLSGRSPPH